jgi:putative tryptophan/tyrosine transport system substrate-binding protein
VATVAARKTTSALPIVFAIGSDPVHLGLVSSLNHPGGNITGISFFTNQMEGKRLGLVHEIAPKAQSIGVLLNPNNPYFESQLKDVTDTSRVLRVNIHIERASSEREMMAAFQAFGQQRAEALLVGSDLFFFSRRAFVIEQAERFRLAGIYEWRQYAEAGGLMSYGTSITKSFRHAGDYVARILRGENLADLPVLQATRFEMVINLKAAQALGIEVPANLSARADDIIE